jgi:hypothetical protein
VDTGRCVEIKRVSILIDDAASGATES